MSDSDKNFYNRGAFKIGLKHWTGTAIVAVLAGFVIFGLLRGQEILNDFLKSEPPTDANLERGELLVLLSPSPTLTPEPTLRPSPSLTPTVSPALTPASTLKLTPTPSSSPLPAPKPTPFPTPISTPTPTLTPTFSPTPTPAPTSSPTPAPSPTPSPTPTPTPAPSPISPSNVNHILISEIQLTGGPGKTTNDFIGLYNPANSSVDISGWRLRKKTQTGTESSIRVFGSGKVIPSRGFFLWANSGDGFAQFLAADESSTATIAANNSIAFLNSEGDIIDSVSWGENLQNPFGEGNPITAVLESYQSYERKAWQGDCISAQGPNEFLGNGCDINNNAVDFEIRSVSIHQNSQSQPEP